MANKTGQFPKSILKPQREALHSKSNPSLKDRSPVEKGIQRKSLTDRANLGSD
jgi:hypothetical protein